MPDLAKELEDVFGVNSVEEKEDEVSEEVVEEDIEGDLDTEAKDEDTSEKADDVEGDDGKGDEEAASEEVKEDVKEEVKEEVIEEDDLTIARKQNELLLKRLEALEGVKPAVKAAEAEPKEKDESKKVSFLTDDDDIDEILSKKEKLNEFALRIYTKAMEDASVNARENTLRSIPEMVIGQVQQQLVLREGIREFFDENKDLLPARRTVGAFTNEVVGEHPEWTLKQVFGEAEKRTREALGIKKLAVKGVVKERNPALQKGIKGNKAKQADRRSGLQSEIDDVINI